MELELEEMRQQLDILKNKLDNQTIVNDRFIRKSMKANVNAINKRYLIIMIVALAMIPYGYWAFVMMNGLSIWLWIACCVLMLMVVAFNFFNGHALRDPNLMNDSLVETKRTVLKAKKRDNNWLFVGIPLVMAWASWAVYELSQQWDDTSLVIPWCIVCILAGVAIGLKVHFRTQRHFDDIVEQIEELEA